MTNQNLQYEELTFRTLTKEDIPALTGIMKKAFDRDAQLHLGIGEMGPPGYDNGEFLTKWGLHKNSSAYKIEKDGKTIGAVIVWINENRVNFLGNIFIDPDLQDRGVGQKIWSFIERQYPDTRVWQTETPGFSTRNHNFYVNKLGFHVTKIHFNRCKQPTGYFFEKMM